MELPEVHLFDSSHLSRLGSVLAQGQTVAVLFAAELQSYISSAVSGIDFTGAMAITIYILSVLGLIIIFLFSSLAINERRAKEFFYHQALKSMIMIDFNNHDKVLFAFPKKEKKFLCFKIKPYKVSSRFLNIGSFSMFFTSILVFILVVSLAITREGLSLDALVRLFLIWFSLARLYAPYSDFYETENTLLSISKFVESGEVFKDKVAGELKGSSEI